MSIVHLTAPEIRRALAVRDLTDPSQGLHAVQRMIEEIERALSEAWDLPVRRERAHPVVSVEENYDRLRVPGEAAARDARYTRYLNDRTVLRTMTSVMIPPMLDGIARSNESDAVLSCPGMVWRRDVIDRRHVGEPHQLDIWRIRRGIRSLEIKDLTAMIAIVAGAALPGREWRTIPAEHPYTTDGRQIDIRDGNAWIEVGECGLAHPGLLAGSGLQRASGLAMGLGLDRLVMLRKNMGDIRLLRAADPRIAKQMTDLEPYRPVSVMPAVRRDLSIAVRADATPEQLADRVRAALGRQAQSVEEIVVMSETPADVLPQQARARLGARAGQKNVLLQVVLRDLERTLTDDEANGLRDRIYAALHEGTAHQWARGPVTHDS